MRKIKFRAWDNLEKAYLNKNDIAIDNLGNIFILQDYDNNEANLWYARLLPDLGNERYIIEQFTGLTDRNGVGIYEGDFVKVKHKDWIEPTIHMVKWGDDEEYPAFDLSPEIDETMNGFALAIQSDLFSIKIIGNIHENPELSENAK